MAIVNGQVRWSFPWPSPQEFLRRLEEGHSVENLVQHLFTTLGQELGTTTLEINGVRNPVTEPSIGRLVLDTTGYTTEVPISARAMLVNRLYSLPVEYAVCPVFGAHNVLSSLLVGKTPLHYFTPAEATRLGRSRLPWGICDAHLSLICNDCQNRTDTLTLPLETYRAMSSYVCTSCGARLLMNRTITTKLPNKINWRTMSSNFVMPREEWIRENNRA